VNEKEVFDFKQYHISRLEKKAKSKAFEVFLK